MIGRCHIGVRLVAHHLIALLFCSGLIKFFAIFEDRAVTIEDDKVLTFVVGIRDEFQLVHRRVDNFFTDAKKATDVESDGFQLAVLAQDDVANLAGALPFIGRFGDLGVDLISRAAFARNVNRLAHEFGPADLQIAGGHGRVIGRHLLLFGRCGCVVAVVGLRVQRHGCHCDDRCCCKKLAH